MSSVFEMEIVELHDFFNEWFNAVLPKTREAFNRMHAVMDEGFTIVMPGGRRVERGPLLDHLFDTHGGRPGLRIWIENVRMLADDGRLAVVEYEEWQEEGGQTTSRYSTAAFERRDGTPNGLVWIRVHETWFSR